MCNTKTVLSIIVARATNGTIGQGGKLPWHLPSDLARFKRITTGHPVVMGRATWESLPEAFQPLPERTNIVLTRQAGYQAEGAIVVPSFADACIAAMGTHGAEEVFIIGGGEIYREAMLLAQRIYLTLVHAQISGDTFFPTVPPESWAIRSIEPSKHWDPRDTHVTSFQMRERIMLP